MNLAVAIEGHATAETFGQLVNVRRFLLAHIGILAVRPSRRPAGAARVLAGGGNTRLSGPSPGYGYLVDPTLAFVMALIALILTLITITVNILNFKMSAGHVAVEMQAALLNPTRSLVSNEGGGWGLNVGEFRPTGMELAKVVIDNPGRTGATIADLVLRAEGSEHTVSTHGVRAIAVEKLSDTLGGITTAGGLPHRLEPYDRAVYLIDFWAVADQIFKKEPQLRQVNLWASVKVAGQPHTYESKKRGYWTIRRDWASLISPYSEQSAENIILTELMRVFDEPGQTRWLPQLASKIERRIGRDGDAGDITAALQQVIGPGWDGGDSPFGSHDVWRLMSFGFQVREKLDSVGANVIWTSTPDASSAAPWL